MLVAVAVSSKVTRIKLLSLAKVRKGYLVVWCVLGIGTLMVHFSNVNAVLLLASLFRVHEVATLHKFGKRTDSCLPYMFIVDCQ